MGIHRIKTFVLDLTCDLAYDIIDYISGICTCEHHSINRSLTPGATTQLRAPRALKK